MIVEHQKTITEYRLLCDECEKPLGYGPHSANGQTFSYHGAVTSAAYADGWFCTGRRWLCSLCFAAGTSAVEWKGGERG